MTLPSDSPPVAPVDPGPPPRPEWPDLGDEALLGVAFRDLGLSIEASALEPRISQLHEELAARGITFRPHYWLSTEWFCPDGVPGIAIPFYLAHPRLMKLEKAPVVTLPEVVAPEKEIVSAGK